jgi:two-component system CheB/CheR fusion protein
MSTSDTPQNSPQPNDNQPAPIRESNTPVAQSAVAAGGMLSAASSQPGVVNDVVDETGAQTPVAVVGLGASAGGIKVLQAVLEGMPRDSGLAFVVVMHLSPDFESNLAEVLQTRSVMPVQQVTDVVRVEANCVYVIPPNKHIAMQDSHLYLTERQDTTGKRVAIDLFFRTLAAAYGQRAVCAVLSGTDSDGVIGLKHIKEQGGVTIAQDPDEAEYDSMPRSAIDTGMVDWILPAHEIAPRLLRFARNEERMHLPPEDSPDGDPAEALPEDEKAGGALSAVQIPSLSDESALVEVLTYLHARTGHDFSHYKRSTVLRRIARRMQVNMVENIPAYLELLQTTPPEAPALLQDLLINVTNFFRDPASFKALEAHIPLLFAGKTADDQVRVWVCGCATGEEAYTLAMLLWEHAAKLKVSPMIQVFATDIDDEVIAYARAGSYPRTIEADVSQERLRRFFVPDQGRHRVRPEIREIVLFAAHDVLRDSPFSRLDMVTCRNLLIYLKREAQERVFDIFHFSLRPGGLLFLGGSESVDDTHMLFGPLDKKHRLYARRVTVRPKWNVPIPVPSPLKARTLPTPGMATPQSTLTLTDNAPSSVPIPSTHMPAPDVVLSERRSVSFGDLHLALLERYAPPSVIVNENYNIVHLSEHAGRFLQLGGGSPSTNLLKVVHPALRVELRTALFRATQSGSEITVQRVPLQLDDSPRLVTIHVRPAIAPNGLGFVLVVFEDVTASGLPDGVAPTPQLAVDDSITSRLEEELGQLKAQLTAIVEQYEASTEELKASNEELQAMNEELRSASEELQTSKEELQSINEELQTVNNELKSNIDEMGRLNSDLQNLLSSTEIGTIFLDRALSIRRFTPRVQELFNILPTDIGRPLSHITHKLEYSGLTEDALEVMRRLTIIEREVCTGTGECFIARLSPYRTMDDRINGVVLTFVDITERKQAVEAVHESEEQFRRAIEDAPIPIIMHAEDGQVLQISRTWTELTGYTPEEMPTFEAWLNAAYGQGANVVRSHMQELFKGQRRSLDMEFPIQTRGGEERHWSFSASAPGTLRDGRRFIVGMAVDITERRQVEKARSFLASIVDSSEDSMITIDFDRTITSWNRAAENLYGYPADEAIGKPLTMLTLPKDLQEILANVDKVKHSRKVELFDTVRLNKDGREMDLEIALSPVKNDSGEVIGVSTVARDITERKRTEEALRQSEAQLRIAFEAAEMASWDWDLQTNQVHWNARHFELLGLEPHSGPVAPELFFNSIHKEDREIVRAKIKTALDTNTYYHASFRPTNGPDKVLWLEGYGRLVQTDGEGRPLRMSGVMFDVTARRTAEDAVRASEERLRFLVEGTRDYAMFLMDAQRRIFHWNSGAEALFGWSREEVIGQSGDLIFIPEDRAKGDPDKEAELAAREGSAPNIRWHVRKDGSRFWSDGINTSLRNEAGELLGFTKIMRDATREKEADEALQRAHEDLELRVQERTAQLQSEILQRRQVEQAREQLLQRVVNAQEEERLRISRELHDQMGQQLTALLMGLNALPELDEPGLRPPSAAQQVQKLQELASTLMQQMHDLAWQLRPTALDTFGLEAALRQYVQDWAQQGINADVFLRGLKNMPRLPLPVETALYRVTQEALTNVLRHARANNVSVLLERSDNNMVLIVEDDGQGFDTNAEGHPTRLGLLGMQERMDLVGGTLTVESSPDGTTVYARVPLEKAGE